VLVRVGLTCIALQSGVGDEVHKRMMTFGLCGWERVRGDGMVNEGGKRWDVGGGKGGGGGRSRSVSWKSGMEVCMMG